MLSAQQLQTIINNAHQAQTSKMLIKTGAGLGQIVKEKKNQENYDPNDSCSVM